MNMIYEPSSFEDAESAKLERVGPLQVAGMIALGATGLGLMLTGVAAMVLAVGCALARVIAG